ncbi:MAG: hypothetical protein V3V13_07070 [Paracoccaceae bacterium]
MGISIAFAQQFSGLTKSAVMTHIAHSWAHHGQRIDMIEFGQTPTMRKWASMNRALHLNIHLSHEWRAVIDITNSVKHHDITLADLPRNNLMLMRAIVRTCDLMVIPCQPIGVDVSSSLKIVQMCKQANTPVHAIITGLPAPKEQVANAINTLRNAGANVMHAGLGGMVTSANGMLDSYTVMPGHKRTPAQKQVDNLRLELDMTVASTMADEYAYS